jgi:hypothetical protein
MDKLEVGNQPHRVITMNQTHEIQRLRDALREIFARTQPNSVGSVCEHGEAELRLEDSHQCDLDHYESHLRALHALASDALYRPYPVAPACNIRLVNQAPLEDDRARADTSGQVPIKGEGVSV